MITRIKDIEQIVVANRNGIPVHISDVGTVRFGAPKRFGAMTMDGKLQPTQVHLNGLHRKRQEHMCKSKGINILQLWWVWERYWQITLC